MYQALLNPTQVVVGIIVVVAVAVVIGWVCGAIESHIEYKNHYRKGR